MDKLKNYKVAKLSKIGVSLECFAGKCHYKKIKNIIGLYNETLTLSWFGKWAHNVTSLISFKACTDSIYFFAFKINKGN